MNATSSHHEADELLAAAALETLESEELGRVLAHAADCAECARLLDEYRTVTAALSLGLPLEKLDPTHSLEIRNRLLGRIQGSASKVQRGHVNHPRSRLAALDSWAGWAVAAGLAGVLLMHHGFHRPVAYGWVIAGVLAIVLVVFGVYAVAQRRRVAALKEQLESMERSGDN
jgi:hypothetical protein